jgi:hypothetical protein
MPSKRRRRSIPVHIQQQKDLYDRVSRFFDEPQHFQTLCEFLRQVGHTGVHAGPSGAVAAARMEGTGVTLRLLDFLYTRYSRYKPVLTKTASEEHVTVEELYYRHLERYGKMNFDCFRRSERIPFEKNGLVLDTTLGQLVFFMHLIVDGTLEYAKQHVDELQAAMEYDEKHKTRARRHKRMHLSVCTMEQNNA